MEMLRFGGFLTGSNILNYLSRNFDNIIIGRCWARRRWRSTSGPTKSC